MKSDHVQIQAAKTGLFWHWISCGEVVLSIIKREDIQFRQLEFVQERNIQILIRPRLLYIDLKHAQMSILPIVLPVKKKSYLFAEDRQ